MTVNQIRGGKVLTGETGRFEHIDISIENGKIKETGCLPEQGSVFDAGGLYVIPGFIDTHVHGSMGAEFASESESFDEVRKWFAGRGITAIAPTIRCLEPEDIIKAERNIVRESKKKISGAKICGIHIEGPFVSKKYRGVMNPPDIAASAETFKELCYASDGLLKIMTLAPERENALEIIRCAVTLGVNISLGHTDATYEQTMSAIEAGAARATHVFDAMRPFHHREAGVIGAVLTSSLVNCEMICDFVHLSPQTVWLVYKLKGCAGITLISDAGFMSGLGDGEYFVSGSKRIVKDGVCRSEDGKIAGSCVSVLEGAKNLLSLGVPLPDISAMASFNPAKALGIEKTAGLISPGYCADLIVCDEKLDIKAVFIDGERCA